jgi:hypothetical protein
MLIYATYPESYLATYYSLLLLGYYASIYYLGVTNLKEAQGPQLFEGQPRTNHPTNTKD